MGISHIRYFLTNQNIFPMSESKKTPKQEAVRPSTPKPAKDGPVVTLKEELVQGIQSIMFLQSFEQVGSGDAWRDVIDANAKPARYGGEQGIAFLRKYPCFVLRKHKVRDYFNVSDEDYAALMKMRNNEAMQLDQKRLAIQNT
jgi:hypothetical protein